MKSKKEKTHKKHTPGEDSGSCRFLSARYYLASPTGFEPVLPA